MNSDTYTVSHWNEATHARERSILTVEQEFTFDALGFVVLPQLLSPAELSACRHSSSAGSDGPPRCASARRATATTRGAHPTTMLLL